MGPGKNVAQASMEETVGPGEEERRTGRVRWARMLREGGEGGPGGGICTQCGSELPEVHIELQSSRGQHEQAGGAEP